MCPCGTGDRYAECCGPLHSGAAKAGTAEALMRSRYSAFAVGDAAYLLRTWHPGTRPADLDLTGGPRWTGLAITGTTGGSALHASGTVAFRAHYQDADGPGVQTEESTFERVEGEWHYVGPVAPTPGREPV
jgi:SEC-C motif-containing protein